MWLVGGGVCGEDQQKVPPISPKLPIPSKVPKVSISIILTAIGDCTFCVELNLLLLLCCSQRIRSHQ